MTTYGTILIQLRNKSKLSQQEVADFIGVSRSTYISWESDHSSYKVEYITKLADVFKVSPADLLPISNLIGDTEGSGDSNELLKKLLNSKDEIISLLKKQINTST
jgi:transcriptional regulator with XRE-family HTH domain